MFDVQRVATKGGSIRLYVQLDRGKRPVSNDVPALVEWGSICAGWASPRFFMYLQS